MSFWLLWSLVMALLSMRRLLYSLFWLLVILRLFLSVASMLHRRRIVVVTLISWGFWASFLLNRHLMVLGAP